MPQYFANGPWKPRSVQIANPAAGADFSFVVPASVVWRVVSGYAKLTTSATVANRGMIFFATDGAGNNLQLTGGATQVVASTSRTISFASGVTQLDLTAFFSGNIVPLPVNFDLLPGFTFGSSVQSLQVGDQWSLLSLFVLEQQSF